MGRCPTFLNILAILLVVGIIGMFLLAQVEHGQHVPGLFSGNFHSRINEARRAIEQHIGLPPVVPKIEGHNPDQTKSNGSKDQKRKKGRHSSIGHGLYGSRETEMIKSQLPPWRQKAKKAIEKLDRFINS